MEKGANRQNAVYSNIFSDARFLSYLFLEKMIGKDEHFYLTIDSSFPEKWRNQVRKHTNEIFDITVEGNRRRKVMSLASFSYYCTCDKWNTNFVDRWSNTLWIRTGWKKDLGRYVQCFHLSKYKKLGNKTTKVLYKTSGKQNTELNSYSTNKFCTLYIWGIWFSGLSAYLSTSFCKIIVPITYDLSTVQCTCMQRDYSTGEAHLNVINVNRIVTLTLTLWPQMIPPGIRFFTNTE